MTANGLFGELAAWTGLAGASAASTKPMLGSAAADGMPRGNGERVKSGAILDVCDRVLGEPSKRGHAFPWLPPAVDGYYPSQELVVLCQERSPAEDALCTELIPGHGLRLFIVDLAPFQADPGQAFSRLIGELRQIGIRVPAASPTVRYEAPVIAPAPLPEPAIAAPLPAPAIAAPLPAPSLPAPPQDPIRAVTRPRPAPPPPVPAPPPTFPAPAASFPATAKPVPVPAPPLPATEVLPPWPPPLPAGRQQFSPQPPPIAPPRQSVSSAFQPLMAAVQRFTAAPEPFVVPPEPTGAPPEPSAAPAPAPAPTPLRAVPPPPADGAAPFPPGRAPLPAWAAPTPPPPAPSLPTFDSSAPLPFSTTPFPFVRTAPPPLDPVLAALIGEPGRDLHGPRVGQRQAEAAARAARFVEARGAGLRARAAARPGVRPASAVMQAPPNRPGQWWNGTTGAPTPNPFTTAPKPVLDLDGHAISQSNARAEAIERALARGRTIPEPERPPAPTPTPVNPDDVLLGFVVACIVIAELYIGVALFTFSGGPVVLGLGLALDAAARAVGTVAAARSGKEWGIGWRWLCGMGGSPAVAAFAFQRNGALVATDLAPLAGPIAALALIFIVIGLAGIPAGI